MNLGSLTCANMSRARPLARVQFRGWFQPPRRATSTTLRFSKRLSSRAETDYSRQYPIILYILSVFVEFRLFQPCLASPITALIESMNRARELLKLALHFPNRATARLRDFYASKSPQRFALINAIHDAFDYPLQQEDIKTRLGRWVASGFHDILLDIALDASEYPQKNEHTTQREVCTILLVIYVVLISSFL